MPEHRGRLRQRFAATVRNAAPLPESPDSAGRDSTPRRHVPITRLHALTWLVVVLAVAVACSSARVDRAQAVQQVVDGSDGRLSQEQAQCYVDAVLDQIGPAPLRRGASISPEQQARLTTIRVDCVGLANLGRQPTEAGTALVPDVELAGPKEHGDDPDLDALWDRCAVGYGQACDDLFDRAVLGSPYEQFAVTCGQRTREAQCAAVYPAPGVTLPSAAQGSTTVPPPPP